VDTQEVAQHPEHPDAAIALDVDALAVEDEGVVLRHGGSFVA
jgi:hypothetical protein